MEYDPGPVATALENWSIIIGLVSQLPQGSDVRTVVAHIATSGHAHHIDGYFKMTAEASLDPDNAFEEVEIGKEHDAEGITVQRLFYATIDRDCFTQILHVFGPFAEDMFTREANVFDLRGAANLSSPTCLYCQQLTSQISWTIVPTSSSWSGLTYASQISRINVWGSREHCKKNTNACSSKSLSIAAAKITTCSPLERSRVDFDYSWWAPLRASTPHLARRRISVLETKSIKENRAASNRETRGVLCKFQVGIQTSGVFLLYQLRPGQGID